MRVCQPGPLAFQRASVSGGILKLMDTFGFGDLGRPRGFNSRASLAGSKLMSTVSIYMRIYVKSTLPPGWKWAGRKFAGPARVGGAGHGRRQEVLRGHDPVTTR